MQGDTPTKKEGGLVDEPIKVELEEVDNGLEEREVYHQLYKQRLQVVSLASFSF